MLGGICSPCTDKDNKTGDGTCNITQAPITQPLLQWKSNKYYIF